MDTKLDATLAVLLVSGCAFDPKVPSADDDVIDEAHPGLGGSADAGTPGESPDGSEVHPDAGPPPCPASYALTIAGSSSRYRIVAAPAVFAIQHATCRDDAFGSTHLVAPDSASELLALAAHAQAVVPQPPYGAFYVGAVQRPGELALAGGWLAFSGAALPLGSWATTQPNDVDHWENFDEQRAVMDPAGALHDVSGAAAYGAICECDRRAIPPSVTTALQF